MTLDQDTVVLRLGIMNDLLGDLESIGEVDASLLRSDRITRHALERILTQLVDLAVAINAHVAAAAGSVPGTYRESFVAAADSGFIPVDLAERLAPSAGLRNILTHEYVEVDLALVATAARTARVDYRAYVESVARALAAR